MPETTPPPATPEQISAQLDLLAAQSAHWRAQAESLRQPISRNPALWTVIGTVLVAGVGYIATFRSQAYEDLLKLREQQATSAEQQAMSAKADLKQVNQELESRRQELKAYDQQLWSAQENLRKASAERNEAEREALAAQRELYLVRRALEVNADRVRMISSEVAGSAATNQYIQNVFGTDTERLDREKLKQVVGFVVGRTMRTRQDEIDPLLRKPQ